MQNNLNFVTDTGVACNVIGKSTCKEMGLEMQPCHQKLVGYDSNVSPVAVRVDANLVLSSQNKRISFLLSGEKSTPIMGLPGFKAYGLCKKPSRGVDLDK